jgi:hypothetical protein
MSCSLKPEAVMARNKTGYKTMQDLNKFPDFDVTDLEALRNWHDTKGKDVFRTYSGAEWFVRTHREELLRSGLFFPGRGQALTRVAPNFGKLVIQILQREALEDASAST